MLVGDRRRRNRLDPHPGYSCSIDTRRFGGGEREIDDATAHEGSAIGNPHNHRLIVRKVRNAHHAAEGQCPDSRRSLRSGRRLCRPRPCVPHRAARTSLRDQPQRRRVYREVRRACLAAQQALCHRGCSGRMRWWSSRRFIVAQIGRRRLVSAGRPFMATSKT